MSRLLRKTAEWIQVDNERKLAVGDYGKGDDTKETYMQTGILALNTLDNAVGFRGEQRQWTEDVYGDGKYFGLYSEEKWNEFLEDIETNGVQDPVVINVNSDGSIKIWEGNHRVEACRQLGINQIPAKVYYMGGSQDEYKIL